MTYLIDTDVMVDFFKHKDPANGLIARLGNQATLALSTLTITELRSGWTSEQAHWFLPRLYALCAIVPITKEIAEQAGKWRQEYKTRGQQLGTPDTVIAATAYLQDYSLVTNNAKDYPMAELTLFKSPQEGA
jgi:predicted nucleic acid-binding protein